ncbi:hypothetical protein LSH36_871g01040 [Paralvinella palmiformis]|uniref:Syntaxin-7 n=1 Tax=Paralvinella palmiformis TaxID=53620 RepID=A0AAD9IZ03_9ANNE|nr:hypothetical protein LSH36_871g01040 [Paralvinella palmiformis]
MANRGSFGSYEQKYSSYQTASNTSDGRDHSNDFTRLSQVVGNNIQKISQNVGQIQRMINQIGTPQDSADLRDKLHQIQHYTGQLAKEANRSLKDLAHLPPPSQQSDQRQWKMQKERLTSEFTSILNSFQAAQRKAAEKEKESVARVKAHSGHSQDPFLDDRKGDDQLVSFDRGVQQSVQMEEDIDLQIIQEREKAIRQLESDIMDVNQIFKDLGMLVHEQGEMVDSIEANVQSTEISVESGTQELQKAREYQKKSRRKKCLLALVGILILIFIILIIYLAAK